MDFVLPATWTRDKWLHMQQLFAMASSLRALLAHIPPDARMTLAFEHLPVLII